MDDLKTKYLTPHQASWLHIKYCWNVALGKEKVNHNRWRFIVTIPFLPVLYLLSMLVYKMSNYGKFR